MPRSTPGTPRPSKHWEGPHQLGFKRSSQHLQGGACGTTEGLEHDDDREADAAVTGSAWLAS